MSGHGIAGSRPALVSLGGLMLAASIACGAPPPRDASDPEKEQVVAVILKMDAGNPVSIDRADPDRVLLSKNLQQRAHWYLSPPTDAKLEITMKDGTKPFRKNPKSYGKHALSDPPEDGSVDTEYRYNILVTLKDGKQLKLDPIIRVVP